MQKELRLLGGGVIVLLLTIGIIGAIGTAVVSAEKPERFIVTFDEPVNKAAEQALENAGGQVVKTFTLINGAVVLVPNKAAVNAIGALSGVKAVEEDARVFALHHRPGHDGGPGGGGGGGDDSDSPSQPAETLEWGVDRIDADLAWGASRGNGVNIAIIDTGIDLDHADLSVAKAVDCTKGPNCAKAGNGDDDNGHGTHVAGIVGARDNDIGVIGVAPEASLFAVKVLGASGSGFTSDVIEGVEWAVQNGAHVLNLSLGSTSDVQAFHDAVDAANNAGVAVVAAAGNSGDGDGSTNEVIYPAKYSSVIAVSATASDDSTPTWSSEGEEVEVAAPGLDIRSTWNDGLYKTISGTSMASPHAAGTAALVLATGIFDANGDGNVNDEVRFVLQTTADDLGTAGHDNFYGYGLVDAEESVTGSETN